MCRRIIAYLAISLLLLVGCSSPPHLSGYLYAFSNNEFTVTDLDTGKIIADLKGPQSITFLYAVKIDDRTILLSSGFRHTWQYNRFTGKLTPFVLPRPYLSGLSMSVYVPKYKSVMFYCALQNGQYVKLCRASFDNPNDVTVVDSGGNLDHGLGGDSYYPIVLVSDDEVVYGANDDTAKYYNLATGKVGYLPFGKCVPQLWRSKTQQLLCFRFQPKAHYYFTKQNGTGKARAPNFDGMPVIYLPDYDTVLAGGLQLKWHIPDPIPYEWSILRSYDLTHDGVHAFASGSWVGQGNVAWFLDVPKDIPGITLAAPTPTPATPSSATSPNGI